MGRYTGLNLVLRNRGHGGPRSKDTSARGGTSGQTQIDPELSEKHMVFSCSCSLASSLKIDSVSFIMS